MSAPVKSYSGPPTGRLSSSQRTDFYKTVLKNIHTCLPKLDKDKIKTFNPSNIHKLSTTPMLEYRILVGGTQDGQYQVHACVGEVGYNKVTFLRGNSVMKYKDITEVSFNKPFAEVNRGNPTTSAGRAQVEALVLYYFMIFLTELVRDKTVDVTLKFWNDFEVACGHISKAERNRQLQEPNKDSPMVSHMNKISTQVLKVNRSTQVDMDSAFMTGKRQLEHLDAETAKRRKGGATPKHSELDLQIKHLTKAFALKSQEVDNTKLDLEQDRTKAMSLVNKTKAQVSALETKLASSRRLCEVKRHELRGMTNQIRDLQSGQQKEIMKALELDEKCRLLQKEVDDKVMKIAELQAGVGVMNTKAIMATGFMNDVMEIVGKYGKGLKVET